MSERGKLIHQLRIKIRDDPDFDAGKGIKELREKLEDLDKKESKKLSLRKKRLELEELDS